MIPVNNPKKQTYRAIKYVWNKEWIGEDAFQKELICAKQACISDVVQDWSLDQKVEPTESQVRLTINHVAKYGTFTASRIDRCYTKCILEISILNP